VEDFYINDYTNNKLNKLQIKLKNINSVTNMKGMLFDCSSILSLSDISRWNTKNVTNMSYLFNSCSSLPDISNGTLIM